MKVTRSLLGAAVGAALLTPVAAARADDPPARTVTLRGQTIREYPARRLRELGLEVEELAEDQNAAYVYIRAYNARAEIPADLNDALQQAAGGEWPGGEAGERLAAWLSENAEALSLARTAATMPSCRMPVFGDENGSLYELQLPLLAEHRTLVRMVAAEAARQRAHGDAAAALDTAVTIQRMANHVASGYTLIEHLVGLACGEAAARTVVAAATDESLDAARLQRCGEELERLAAEFPTWEMALRFEELAALNAVEQVFAQPGALRPLLAGGLPGGAAQGDTAWARLGSRLYKLFMPDRTMKQRIRQFYRDVKAGVPAAAGGTPPEAGRTLHDSVPAWDMLARTILPALDRSFEIHQIGMSNVRRARLTLAVEAYRRATGRPPASLSDLVPTYLRAVPIDPRTGHAFDYSPPSTPGAAGGLELISRERRPAAAPQPPPGAAPGGAGGPSSEWRQYVDDFAARMKLDAAQRKAAYAVLDELERRAAAYRRAKGAEIETLRAELARTADAARRKKLADEMHALSAPLDAMFDELRRRIEALPTAPQKDAAKSRTDGGPNRGANGTEGAATDG